MRDLIVIAAILLLIYWFMLRKQEDGLPCDVIDMNSYRFNRTQKQPVP